VNPQTKAPAWDISLFANIEKDKSFAGSLKIPWIPASLSDVKNDAEV